MIRYRTTRQIGFFVDYDELYWNVTGTGWAFPIDMAEARITLPEKVPFRQTAVYTGPQGAQGQGRDHRRAAARPHRVPHHAPAAAAQRSHRRRRLAEGRGRRRRPRPRRAQYWLEDNRALVVAVLGFLLLLGYYAYRLAARRPRSAATAPSFRCSGRPTGCRRRPTRYVDRMAFDNGCFTAAIIGLGVKGHLQLVERGRQVDAREARRRQAAWRPRKQALMSKLFAREQQRSCSSRPITSRSARPRTALGETLAKSYLGKLFTNNFGWSGVGLLLLVLIAVAVLLAARHGDQCNIVPVTMVMLMLSVCRCVMAGGAMAFSGWQQLRRGKWLLIGGLILLALPVGVGDVRDVGRRARHRPTWC